MRQVLIFLIALVALFFTFHIVVGMVIGTLMVPLIFVGGGAVLFFGAKAFFGSR